jgi:hypothetical protein
MTHEKELAHLRVENQTWREALCQAPGPHRGMEKQKTTPAACVRANDKTPSVEEKKPRTKRELPGCLCAPGQHQPDASTGRDGCATPPLGDIVGECKNQACSEREFAAF